MTPTPDRDAHGDEVRERLLAEVRDVLRPFAEAAASYDPDEGDDHQPAWAHDFMIGSLRAARALLDKMEGR